MPTFSDGNVGKPLANRATERNCIISIPYTKTVIARVPGFRAGCGLLLNRQVIFYPFEQ